jgi:hypothetical protein
MSLRAAALESESARRVAAGLANATLTWGAYTATGVFDADYADRLGLVTRQTRFTGLASALPAIAQGVSVTVGGVTYTVRNVEPDNTGFVALVLERV